MITFLSPRVTEDTKKANLFRHLTCKRISTATSIFGLYSDISCNVSIRSTVYLRALERPRDQIS